MEYEEVDCDNLLWVEKIQFPIPSQAKPDSYPQLLADEQEVYLYKYSEEKLIYGMPTYYILGVKLA